MSKKEFKAESKRLLDLMINSIYTHKEIFLRELISNASDAMDKLYFCSLTNQNIETSREDLQVKIEIDKENRVLKITDNGCGMTKEELETNLGTIAKSGSLAFKKENEKKDDVEIIGQFGVGFYSAFMVSDFVTVTTKSFNSDKAYIWQSEGTDGYTVEECEKNTVGTEIVLNIKDNTDEENYDEFLEEYRIKGLIKKYSDYIRYPITMDVAVDVKGENDENITEIHTETLNSMVPIWRKTKSELGDDDYNNFYKEKFFDFENPLKVISTKTEGTATYNALLFIPAKVPYDYYTKEFEKGLQLYANGVLIMDKCSDLLPDYFSFVKGLVDSADLSLNISREMLQHDRQLKIIAKSLEKKIKSELSKMLKNEREEYEKFFTSFGLQIKFGVYNDYGINKDSLKDLIMFYSSSEKKLVTLSEYVSRMKEDQKYIYYCCGESVNRIENMPQTELVKDKGMEILYLTDNVDEFALKTLMDYDSKEFMSISSGDLDLETEEEKQEIQKQSDENKSVLEYMGQMLEGKVQKVQVSQRLKKHPVCLSSTGDITLEMEKIINSMPTDNKVKAQRVLEINPNHPVFETICGLYETDKEKLSMYSKLLYTQALLIEGLPIDDPVEFSNEICQLMI